MDSKPQEEQDDKNQIAENNDNQQDSNDDDFKSCEDEDEKDNIKENGHNNEELNFQEISDSQNLNPFKQDSAQYDNGHVFNTEGNDQENGSSFHSSSYFNGSLLGLEVEQPDQNELSQNPFIMSDELSMGPHSFIDSRQKANKLTPPPIYFTKEYVDENFALPTTKNDILFGYDVPNNGGLVCTNQEMLDRQRGVLSHVAQQLVVHAMKGLSISHMSLPIKIFEPRSTIQRIVDLWTFAPKFLKQAAQTDDHLERLKLTIAFTMSSIYMCTGQDKPFNPLLGETHQGSFPDGTKFYCEHTSHHPPITNFLLEDPDGLYYMYGYYENTGKMGGNSFTSGMRGPNNLIFKDGQHIRFGYPSYKLGGTIYGARSIETIGSCTFEDLTNDRKAVLLMSTYKTTGIFRTHATGCKDKFEGVIYNSQPLSGNAESIKKNYGKEIEFVSDLKKIKDIKKQICKVEGSWLENCVIDNQVYWSIEEDIPQRQVPLATNEVLPSDWRYREDLIWLKYNYMRIAQQWKIRLEVQQRTDRSNRKAATKTREGAPRKSKLKFY